MLVGNWTTNGTCDVVVEWCKAVTRVNMTGTFDAGVAEIKVRAVKALVTNAVDILSPMRMEKNGDI